MDDDESELCVVLAPRHADLDDDLRARPGPRSPRAARAQGRARDVKITARAANLAEVKQVLEAALAK